MQPAVLILAAASPRGRWFQEQPADGCDWVFDPNTNSHVMACNGWIHVPNSVPASVARQGVKNPAHLLPDQLPTAPVLLRAPTPSLTAAWTVPEPLETAEAPSAAEGKFLPPDANETPAPEGSKPKSGGGIGDLLKDHVHMRPDDVIEDDSGSHAVGVPRAVVLAAAFLVL